MSAMTETAVTSKRSDAGFWSSAKSFFLPVGPHIERSSVRGYPIDMRVKATVARTAITPEVLGTHGLHVGLTQYALGCYERWLGGEGEQWLQAAIVAGRHLVALQDPDGAFLHHEAFPHTFRLPPPWASGITQGQAASLFVRLHAETADDIFAGAAQRALAPMATPQSQGGVRGELGGLPWPEEYPTEPQSHVLNGAIFGLWGMRDVAVGLGSETARAQFAAGLDSLEANLHRYDTGSWSLYSLYPHPIYNRASSFYHDLHVRQLTAMEVLAPRPVFAATRQRWAGYAASRYSRVTSFAWKAAFRIIVPRNRALAQKLPWNDL